MLEASLENERDSKRCVVVTHELLVKNIPDAREESKSEEDGEEDSESKEEGEEQNGGKESEAEEDDEKKTKIRKDQNDGPSMPEEPRWEL
ncbi:hypothetical protein AMTR_s00043p00190620 [Amborella trichopoda]|uniref:Uncharacterized protein n=1 Tax=Amborella trichopoda TaxID=13333 RepID=W1PX45_AMBTC|nr:hypothetical protein AMTR_s00043p00190620 [Amborella trichopoda]